MNYNIYEELSKLNESVKVDDKKEFYFNYDKFDSVIDEALRTAAEALVQDLCESVGTDFDEISKTNKYNQFNPDEVYAQLKECSELDEYLTNVLAQYLKVTGNITSEDEKKFAGIDDDKEKAERVKEIRSVFPDFYDEEGNLIPEEPEEERPDPLPLSSLTDAELDQLRNSTK